MALTVNEVIERLQRDIDDVSITDMRYFLAVSTQAVKDHVRDKFDPDNMVHQHAIVMLCGYYSSNRDLSKNMTTNGSFLPEPVIAVLNSYYVPLVV